MATLTPMMVSQKKNERIKNMLITMEAKKILFISKFASKDRLHLQGVRFDYNGVIVATDGHQLGKMFNAWTSDNEGFEPFTLPLDKALITSLKSGVMTFIEINGDELIINGCFKVNKLGSNYPDYNKVIPSEDSCEPLGKISFDPRLLNNFVGYEKKSDFVIIKFMDGDPMSPVLIKNTALKDDFVGVLMPCRF